MRNRILSLLLPILFCIVLLSSCKKDDGVTNTDLLTRADWKISTATAAGVDVSSQIPSCYKDNIVSFFSEGTGTVDENLEVCSPSSETDFIWNFENNESVLSMTTNLIPGGSGDFNIVSLSETTMILSQETSLIPSPVPVTIEVTLVHP